MPGRWLRFALLLLAIVLLNLLGGWLVARFDFTLTPVNSDMAYRMVLVIAAVYVLAMAMPFVPGIEIGLAIMLATGPAGVPFVYACTLLALALAFLVGRFVPLAWITRLFAWLHLVRAQQMIEQLARRPAQERLDFVLQAVPEGWAQRFLLYRYIAAAAVLNPPGNAAIGGAGGIALIAGMSHLFRFPLFMLTMAVAITPGPILILLTR
jgi:hypothetical protein